ncbi:MAG: hypothetical protein E7398_00325 [Ruminococcaceae bacterium]|nr:hypothetical protein [Oscillospiraceae bacterium]
MTNKEFVLAMIKEQGKANALDLRNRAADMTGTAIIAEESKIPLYDNTKDYTGWAVGSPCLHDGQVYGLLQPHNAAHYPDPTPSNTPALWRVLHTTDPAKAKPYIKPTNTSDMYLKGECMIYTDGLVYRSLRDTVYSPEEYASDWEAVTND